LYTFLVPFFACSLSGDTKTKQTLEEAGVVKGVVACTAVSYWPNSGLDENKVFNTKLRLQFFFFFFFLLLLLFTSFMQGIYNYTPETNHVSRVYSVGAMPWL
jgi:hypothetical protein